MIPMPEEKRTEGWRLSSHKLRNIARGQEKNQENDNERKKP